MVSSDKYTGLCNWQRADGAAPAAWRFDLQLFSGEKTEDATPKRREDARKKGQVARSNEVNSAFIILASFLALKLMAANIYEELTALMRYVFGEFLLQPLTADGFYQLFLQLGLVFFRSVGPLLLVVAVVGVGINFLQVGFSFSLQPLQPDFERLNPISGLQRLVSKRVLVELAKSLAKVAVIGYFIYKFIRREMDILPGAANVDLQQSAAHFGELIIDLANQIGAVLIVLAAADFFYQWWEHEQSLKMSKQEVKEEMKQTEGNPQIKGKIKEKQRALAMRRMMQEVPKADVIITNPTHFAVALAYQADMPAPKVLAKGQDLIAQRIKEIAKEHRIPIVENKPLARTVFQMVDVGGWIPAELYQAVAEVLAHVYRLKRRRMA